MSKRLAFLLASVIAVYPALSQTLVWKNYSSMYDVNGIATVAGKIWAATTGGVFSYDPHTGTFTEYTTTEGLSNIQATAITADSSGCMLVGEADGSIDELDSAGNVIRSELDIARSSAISKQINALSVAGDTIFACTPFGVVLISRKSFSVLDTYSHFDPSQGSIQANAAAVFDGNIYVASQFGLSYAPRSAVNLAAPDLWQLTDTLGLSSGVNCLAVFDGSLVVGTGSGLYYSNDGRTFQPVAGSPDSTVYSLADGSDYLLVNAATGLYKMSGAGSAFSSLYAGGTQLSAATAYSDTLAVCGTSRGLLLIGSSTGTAIPPGPATNTISNLSIDSSGNLWCSTNLSTDIGVAFMEFSGTKWINYSRADFPLLPKNQSVYQISAVSGNRVIVGTWGYGMLMLSGDSSEYFNNGNSDFVGEPNSPNFVITGPAVCDQSGNIWMTNPLAYNGNPFVVYSPQDSSWHSFHNGLTQTSGFIPIAIDAYGGVWTGDQFGNLASTGYNGVFYYNDNGTLNDLSDDQSYSFTQSNAGLLSNHVNSIIVDSDDQVWIGTDLGLDVIYDPDPSGSFYVQSIYSLLDQNINSIDYDALDQKWVATNTGVYVISRDGNTTIASYNTTNSPLPSDKVLAVACDREHGVVYFATQYGITELKTGVQQPLQNFAKLRIFPDPARLPLSQPIHIEGLIANSSIKIFTIDGRLVEQFQAQGGKIAYWNGTDNSGNLLPTGIYIIVAYSSDGSQSTVGKIAVIRR